MDALDALVHDALLTTALVALPVLVATALVGTVVAVAQAATQVQEQTLTLLPKVITVGVMVALFGKTAMHLLAALFDRALSAIAPLTARW
ncbi:MAG: flagellar biosynthetic protein FliQ [Candidatus Eremiobacteraeota bacterium]|nr:flagellar biosynthetic protein FliQ [Candidatus Eremiobacteraeota bacterium]MBV9264408.1 flagellar biosynthetic protein FliQ [Candidatus Eremiobacteraeota bacterium]